MLDGSASVLSRDGFVSSRDGSCVIYSDESAVLSRDGPVLSRDGSCVILGCVVH